MHDVFYFTDIHGQLPLFNRIMQFIQEQDEDATIIYGGDACDRGPEGYAIMNALLDNPQVVYLKGNHEDMFVRAARALLVYLPEDDSFDPTLASCYLEEFYQDENVELAIWNGGKSTLTDWILDGAPRSFVERINDLPVIYSYENYDFSHAGGHPRNFLEAQERIYNGQPLEDYMEADLIWDRHQFQIGWNPGRIMVHGHTPTIHLPAAYYGRDKSEARIHPCQWVGNFDTKRWPGLRVDMDTGATWGGRIWVLNVLTSEATSIFDVDVNSEKPVHDFQIGLENFKIK